MLSQVFKIAFFVTQFSISLYTCMTSCLLKVARLLPRLGDCKWLAVNVEVRVSVLD